MYVNHVIVNIVVKIMKSWDEIIKDSMSEKNNRKIGEHPLPEDYRTKYLAIWLEE